MPVTASPKRQESKRRQTLQSYRRIHADDKDVGAPEDVFGKVNVRRRKRCGDSLRKFLETYFPEAFSIPFSPYHDELIASVEETVRTGGQFMVLMPRGSGKTTIMVRSVVWAAVYGLRRFIVLIASEEASAGHILDSIKTILETNEKLLDDFPEVIYPIRALERTSARATGQLCLGEPTRIQWAREIQFPQTEFSRKRGNAGIGIKTAGIEGSGIRGSMMTLADGTVIRPDLCLVDDPQNRASAASGAKTQKREDLINSDIMLMSGPIDRMACLVTATSIYEEDLTCRLSDKDRNAHWTTHRVPMVVRWPKDMDLWEQWDAVRRREDLGEMKEGAHRAYYKKNRVAMDEGFQTYWSHRIEEGFLSSNDTAMMHYFKDPRSFASEYQNEPESEIDPSFEVIRSMEVAKRVTGTPRDVCPPDAVKLICHIDVQKRMLFGVVAAVNAAGGLHVINYFRVPEQPTRHFAYIKSRKTLQAAMPGETDSNCVRVALSRVIDSLNDKEWLREGDDAIMTLDVGFIDAGYIPDDVEAALITSRARNWLPMRGVGVSATEQPLGEKKFKRGLQGNHYVLQAPRRREIKIRSMFVDSNYWKYEVYQQLRLPVGHAEAITLYKEVPSHHQLFGDHCAAEIATKAVSKGRTVFEWKLPNKNLDNHHFDNLVGCAVGSAMVGIHRQGVSVAHHTKAKAPTNRQPALTFRI